MHVTDNDADQLYDRPMGTQLVESEMYSPDVWGHIDVKGAYRHIG